MMQGIYSGAAAMDAYAKRQEVFAANMANISSAGFKRRVDVSFSEELKGDSSRGQGVRAPKVALKIDFTPGEVLYTKNPLHISLENSEKPDGNAFYAVVNDDGQELYARAGRLSIDSSGRLVNATSGYALVNPNGAPIQLNQGGGRNLEITHDGSILQDQNNVGMIKTVRFASLRHLSPVNNSLFSAGKNSGIESTKNGVKVKQGYLENSNVNSVSELVNMIANYRSYEASQRIVRQMDQSAQQLNKIV